MRGLDEITKRCIGYCRLMEFHGIEHIAAWDWIGLGMIPLYTRLYISIPWV